MGENASSGPSPRVIKFDLFGALIGMGLNAYAGWRLSRAINVELVILLYLFGATMGILAGVLMHPYEVDPKESFREFTKILSGFVSGYLLSFAQRLLEEQYKTPNLNFMSAVLVFLNSLLMMGLATYAARAYLSTRLVPPNA